MGSYFASKGRYQLNYKRLYNLLVPAQGPAATPEGEVLRVLSKVYYRVHNDGDGYAVLRENLPAGFSVPMGAPQIVHAFFDDIRRRRKGKVDGANMDRVVDAAIQWVASIVDPRYSAEELFQQRVKHESEAVLATLAREAGSAAHRNLAAKELHHRYRKALERKSVPEIVKQAEETNNPKHRQWVAEELERRYAAALKDDMQDMTPATLQQMVRNGEKVARKRSRSHNSNSSSNSGAASKRLTKVVKSMARNELAARPRREALFAMAMQYADDANSNNQRRLDRLYRGMNNATNKEVLAELVKAVNDRYNSKYPYTYPTNMMEKLRHHRRLVLATRAARNKKAELGGRNDHNYIMNRAKNMVAKAAQEHNGWNRLQGTHMDAAARYIEWLTADQARAHVTELVSILQPLPAHSWLRTAVESSLRRSIKSTAPFGNTEDLVKWAAKLPPNGVAREAVEAALRHRPPPRVRGQVDAWVRLASSLPRNSIAREAAEGELVGKLEGKEVRYTGKPKPRILWLHQGFSSDAVHPAIVAEARALLPTSPNPEALRRQLDKFPPVKYDAAGRVRGFAFDAWNGQERTDNWARYYDYKKMKQMFNNIPSNSNNSNNYNSSNNYINSNNTRNNDSNDNAPPRPRRR